jgi:hypothetical protein
MWMLLANSVELDVASLVYRGFIRCFGGWIPWIDLSVCCCRSRLAQDHRGGVLGAAHGCKFPQHTCNPLAPLRPCVGHFFLASLRWQLGAEVGGFTVHGLDYKELGV